MKNKFTKNKVSPFLSQQKNWDDPDTYVKDEKIRNNLIDEAGFEKPSKI